MQSGTHVATSHGDEHVSANIDTARRYLEAAYHDDLETCARLVADTYIYIDHATPPRTADPTDDDIDIAWSDRVLVIDRMMETNDGTVVTQLHVSETHTGRYKGVPATGRRFTTSICNLLRFDEHGQIVAEETYYDDLNTMINLGAVQPVDSNHDA